MKKLLAFVFLAAVALVFAIGPVAFLASCHKAVSPAPMQDASCTDWCDNARKLGCTAAWPTSAGDPCETVCQNTLDGPVAFNLGCRATATSCISADQCENPQSTSAPAVYDAAAPPPSASPVTPTDAGGGFGGALPTADRYAAQCKGWCAHAAELKCAAAKPTDAGGSCTDVCLNVMTGPVKWDLSCRSSAKTCKAADACEAQGR